MLTVVLSRFCMFRNQCVNSGYSGFVCSGTSVLTVVIQVLRVQEPAWAERVAGDAEPTHHQRHRGPQPAHQHQPCGGLQGLDQPAGVHHRKNQVRCRCSISTVVILPVASTHTWLRPGSTNQSTTGRTR